MALILGAPDTVPAGKIDLKASKLDHGVSSAFSTKQCGGCLPITSLSQLSRHLRSDMYNMAEFLELHQMVDFHRCWLTDAIDVVPC